jgi:predicted glycosyl hydrolase (DUF1957 family)
MLWLNFLHIYQPPTMEKELLVRITKEAYLNIVKTLENNPRHKLTLNITACLTEYLNQVGFTELIKRIKDLVRKGQVELTGTAAFHPLLPLIPIREVKRQIQVNNDINRRYFGKIYKPCGFYLPEMAYSKEVGKTIKQAGFKWIILDEIALDGKINNHHLNYACKYKIKNLGLNVVFRNRRASRTFVPQTIEKLLKQKEPLQIIITATDGELYGHKYIDQQKILLHILKNKKLTTATISEFLSSTKKETLVSPLDSSWESTPAELKKNIPYSLWKHPKNKIHQKLWQLADFALKLNYKLVRDPNHFSSRLHLEKGLASCTFWWASGKDFKLFNDPAWSPAEVEKGALELLSSLRALNGLSAEEKIRAEKMFLEIHKLIWTKHWRKESNKPQNKK